jgi:hypothetical protein
MIDPVLRAKALELLPDYHENEIGRLLCISEQDGKKICRDIFLNDYGYSANDFVPVEIDDDHWALFADGLEWIDETGDHLIFDSEAEAAEYMDEQVAKELQKEVEKTSK